MNIWNRRAVRSGCRYGAAAADGVPHIAISGHPLTPAERTTKVTTQFEVCTPYVVARSHPGAARLDPADIPALLARIDPVRPDGTPLKIMLRPKAESDNLTVASLFPGMDAAVATARSRDTIPIGATDQDNADLGGKISGSPIGTTSMQMTTEKRTLKLVAIGGVTAGRPHVPWCGRHDFCRDAAARGGSRRSPSE